MLMQERDGKQKKIKYPLVEDRRQQKADKRSSKSGGKRNEQGGAVGTARDS